METLIQAALRMAPALIADRRWLHANPEVGFELNQTSRYVARRLREIGVDCREISPSGLTATIGKCGGGTAANIVPDTAVLEGGFRCFNPEVRERVVPKIHATIEAITATMGGHCTIEKSYTPAVRNDPALCGGMKPFIEEVIGKENLGVSERPISPTDDFAHLGSRVPSMFLQLGAGGLANFPLHNPNVLLDEAALPVGSALLANCAIQWLRLNS